MRPIVGSAPATRNGSFSCACAGRERPKEKNGRGHGGCDPDSKGKVRGMKELKQSSPLCFASTNCPLGICNIRYKGIQNPKQLSGQQKLVKSDIEQ